MTQPPYSSDLAPWDFRLFPKLKSPLQGKRFQTVDEIQENMMGQLMGIGKTVWGPKVPTLKRTEASLSCIQCFLCLVSSSINVSISHITWVDTFWTDLVYLPVLQISFHLCLLKVFSLINPFITQNFSYYVFHFLKFSLVLFQT